MAYCRVDTSDSFGKLFVAPGVECRRKNNARDKPVDCQCGRYGGESLALTFAAGSEIKGGARRDGGSGYQNPACRSGAIGIESAGEVKGLPFESG